MADYQKLVSHLRILDPRTPLLAAMEELLRIQQEASAK